MQRGTASWLGLIVTLVAGPAVAQEVTVDVGREQRSGEVVRGPVTIVMTGVNSIRYRTRIARTTTVVDAPDVALWLPGILGPETMASLVVTGGEGEAPAGAWVDTADAVAESCGPGFVAEDCFIEISESVESVEQRWRSEVAREIRRILDVASRGRAKVSAFVSPDYSWRP